MKANTPERIYISLIPSISGGHVYTTVNKDFPNAVEHTRTDAFIEKACEWFRTLDDKEPPYKTTEEFIEGFKKAMKV